MPEQLLQNAQDSDFVVMETLEMQSIPGAGSSGMKTGGGGLPICM